MLSIVKPFIPLAALATLAGAMGFAPKIGPIVLGAAVLAALLPMSHTGWTPGPREAVRAAFEAIAPGPGARLPLLVIGLFLVVCGLSLFWVPEANFALARTVRLLGFFLVAVLYGLIFARAGGVPGRFLRPMAWLAVAGFALAGLCMALSFALIVPGKVSPDGFVNRAVVVFSLSVFAFSAYIWAADWPRALKSGLTALVVTCGFALSLSSNSQTSTMALGFGLLAVLVFGFAAPGLRRLLVWTAAGSGLAMPLLICAVEALPKSLFSAAFFQHSSALDRLAIWRSYLVLVRERPLLGWGLEGSRNFDPALLSSPVTAAQAAHFSTHPHNAFLQMWTDLGLAGALAFCALVVLLGLRIEKTRAESRAPIYGLFVGIVATSAISHGAFQSWWMASMAILIVSVFPLADPEDRT